MLLVFDGSNLLYRIMYVSVNNKNVTFEFMLFLTLQSIFFNMKKYNATKVIMTWDGASAPSHRLLLYKNYKSNRSKKDGEEHDIRRKLEKYLIKFLPRIGIINLKHHDLEADDLSYFLSNKVNLKSIMITEDRDWIISINKHFSVHTPVSKKIYNLDYLKDNYGEDYIDKFILCKALLGDGSDNIPGIKGVGGKSCLHYAEAILYNKEFKKGKLSQKVRDNLEQLDIYRKVIDIRSVLSKSEELIKLFYKEFLYTLEVKNESNLEDLGLEFESNSLLSLNSKRNIKLLNNLTIENFYENINNSGHTYS